MVSSDVISGLDSKLRLDPADLVKASPGLQLVYETAPVGLAFLSTDCRYLMINQHLTEICGISIDDHLGHSVREMVPQVAEQVEQIVQHIVQSGAPIMGVEVYGQRADGSNVDRVWITYWHPLKDSDGKVVGINVAAEEITDRKRAESERAAMHNRLQQLNESLAERVEIQAQERDRFWRLSQDLLIVTDAQGTVLNINPAWTIALGWTAEDLVGKTGEWLIHPDDREKSSGELVSLRLTNPVSTSKIGSDAKTALIDGCPGAQFPIGRSDMPSLGTSPILSRPRSNCTTYAASLLCHLAKLRSAR